ncbi:MAG TPA: DoxX family protein [Micromonosporaceae bacterium]
MRFADRYHGATVSLFRIVVGLLFSCHGAASLFGVFGGAMGKGGTVPVGEWPGWYAAVIQLVAGILVLVGLGTRAAALLASGSMAYAYFTVHQERALLPIQNGGELAAMFSWSFLLLAVVGPGIWSIDAVLRKERSRSEAKAPAVAPLA